MLITKSGLRVTIPKEKRKGRKLDASGSEEGTNNNKEEKPHSRSDQQPDKPDQE